MWPHTTPSFRVDGSTSQQPINEASTATLSSPLVRSGLPTRKDEEGSRIPSSLRPSPLLISFSTGQNLILSSIEGGKGDPLSASATMAYVERGNQVLRFCRFHVRSVHDLYISTVEVLICDFVLVSSFLLPDSSNVSSNDRCGHVSVILMARSCVESSDAQARLFIPVF